MSQGGEKYKSSFYVYEELASAPSTTTPSSLVAQAVADIHLNRLPEAEATLQQALELEPTNAQALANQIVLATLSGRPRAEVDGLLATLAENGEGHPILDNRKQKEALFDEAAKKYKPRVAVAG